VLRRLACFVAVLLTSLSGATAARSTGGSTWSYLHDGMHSSYEPASTALATANPSSLVKAWNWTPPRDPNGHRTKINATPAVYDGGVFVGANDGVFYALDEATGAVRWRRSFGMTPSLTCSSRGFVSSATVAPDPTTGQATVYVGAPDGYLYALNASDGTTVWTTPVAVPSTTVNDYFLWGSPTLAAGRVYIGISSHCDKPLVRGGLSAFSQTTGEHLATYYSVPAGKVGGSVWTTAAVTADGNGILISTGNSATKYKVGDSFSIVRLTAGSLAREDAWAIPAAERVPDSDFGASPALFPAVIGGQETELVGACNKNGVFYALRADALSAGPVWQTKVGAPESANGEHCQASALWDGQHLYVATNTTTINGQNYPGSVAELEPTTGAIDWQVGLSCGVMGTPSMNGAGVIAVGCYDFTPGVVINAYLLDARTGSILRTFPKARRQFAQPVMVDNLLLMTTVTYGITAYKAF
jgi:polyvinyl alcohol dehydrogenase (cytochrome)